jgi:TldD protein
MRDRILHALQRSPADYTDIRLERSWRTEVMYRGPNLENLESSSDVGGIIRCLAGGGWGIAVFNSLDGLEERVQDAARMARLVSTRSDERTALAPVAPVQQELRATLERDPRTVPLREKQALLQHYNEAMLKASDKIITTMAMYRDAFTEVTIANSSGTFIVEERPDLELALIAVAREGESNIQQAMELYGMVAGFEAAAGQEERAETAARRALQLLAARPVSGGTYTVVMDQDLAGVLTHESFGHLCEADFLSKNPRLREILQPGRVFGVPELNIVDDGYIPGLRGNYQFDDEGTSRRKVHLIQNGVLQGFLHSRETAARMGAEPTGNARAVSYRFEPIVRMRNTYIDRGTIPFEEMLRGVDRGIYACGCLGGQTALEQFTFSAAYAYEIVDGQIGEMLRDVVLTGNIFETLKSIDCIGDDLVILSQAYGCGKMGQFGLPVTDGAPHVRIQNLTIGGRTA